MPRDKNAFRCLWLWLAFFAAVIVLALCGDAQAFGRRNRGGYSGGYSGGYTVATSAPAGHSNATAQGVANWMAATGTVGHCGGNRGPEGCGMASTKEGAYGICCFANNGWRDIDVGYAQGRNGYWYCCRRYAQ